MLAAHNDNAHHPGAGSEHMAVGAAASVCVVGSSLSEAHKMKIEEHV